jgi:hypothetical protein
MDNLLNKKIILIDGSLAAELKRQNYDFEVILISYSKFYKLLKQ